MQPSKAREIFNQIGFIDCDNYEATSFEDVRFIFWWRHIYEINRDRCSWAYFLLAPSVEFNFVIPTAKKKDREDLYSLPFGNDGHWSVGFDAGIDIDFVETVEIGFYGGLNYFFPRTVKNYRIPTDIYQQSIFPFATEVKLSPGLNFNWRFVFNAYHFIDRFSAFAEYVLVKHERDGIEQIFPDPAFLIQKAECTTKFVSQFVNTSLYYDISPNIQLGVAEIRQTVTGLIDRTPNIPPQNSGSSGFGGNCPLPLCPGQPFDNNFFRNIPVLTGNQIYTTCNSCDPNPCTGEGNPDSGITTSCTNPYLEIESQLMQPSKAREIFNQIGFIDCDNYEATSFEDVRFIFWWRHIYEINRDRCSWAYFLLAPSVEFNFVIPTAKKKDREDLYSLPFGNDGHWSVGFDAGIDIDFVETVEIGFYGGLNYFFPRTVKNYRIPTDIYQQSIFPFATEVKLSPGLNFNWRFVFNAYHFIDRFSAFAEYVLVKHERDGIEQIFPDPAFLIQKAECTTKFVSQFVNTSLYYDISPNIQLGVLAQFPVAQRNAYRSSMYMGTFRALF
jgi:hypothetical protein